MTLSLFTGLTVKAQEDDNNDRIREKMQEFIQKRLRLSNNEAERFTPVFIRYFREWRQNLRESDVLIRQQKIVELKLRYRAEFRPIVGDKRSNAIFKQQEDFIDGLKKIRQERLEKRQPRVNRLNDLNH